MKRLKLLLGRFIKSITEEVVNSKIEDILNAGTRRDKEVLDAITELDIFGGLMSREEFVKKLKHTIKLIDLRKVWIEASIYKRKGLPKIEMLTNLEKEAKAEYEKMKREGREKETLICEGALNAFEIIKEALEK